MKVLKTIKDVVEEAIEEKGDVDLRDVDLRDADLRGADLSDAELNCAKFYGRGGTIKIMKKDLNGFLGALGFILEY